MCLLKITVMCSTTLLKYASRHVVKIMIIRGWWTCVNLHQREELSGSPPESLWIIHPWVFFFFYPWTRSALLADDSSSRWNRPRAEMTALSRRRLMEKKCVTQNAIQTKTINLEELRAAESGAETLFIQWSSHWAAEENSHRNQQPQRLQLCVEDDHTIHSFIHHLSQLHQVRAELHPGQISGPSPGHIWRSLTFTPILPRRQGENSIQRDQQLEVKIKPLPFLL